MPENQIATARVPGSTSNIGPGYDCLGIALALHNDVCVERLDHQGVEPAHRMVEAAAAAYFSRAAVPSFGFRWSIGGEVPISRGLGSSVTLRLGIMQALDALSGSPLGKEALFQICTELEGHPDNAGPAAFGGFIITNARGDYFRFEVDPKLKFALLIPPFEVLTEPAREVLPESIRHVDGARSMANACSITAAFATGEYGKLRGAFEDYLHQPYRRHLVPGLMEIIAAGEKAGALGGFLSGSGSTICCPVLEDEADPAAVAAAMRSAHQTGEGASVRIVTADNAGSSAGQRS